ncbi:DUF5686 family protein [Limibacter armeniacum]|uniref:DUF5686 and carboxypeptidase-like regulatory domain-containing protein n=1 Tax=Limibacter armeniacum TaxID=466084 RepID=UPI002FE65F06
MSWLLLFGVTGQVLGQQYRVSGTVKDKDTGESLPFVNVRFQGTTVGVTTDLEGKFSILTDVVTDSLTASYVGYTPQTIPFLKNRRKHSYHFKLSPDTQMLGEVEVIAGKYENPAWEVLRTVVKDKKHNDRDRLKQYAYESYTKSELIINNLSEKLKKRKVVQDVLELAEKSAAMKGKDGQTMMPLFVSESLQDVYVENQPARKHIDVNKTRVVGIGIEDEGTISQITTSTFKEYNFYNNYVRLLGKDFVSPIADSWKFYYDYELALQKEQIGKYECYRIDFKPKHEGDLAFEGTMWITDSTYHHALVKVDATISKEANLNFIEEIEIHQQLEQVSDNGLTAWIPSSTAVLVDVEEINDYTAGVLARYKVSNKDYQLTYEPVDGMFDQELTVLEGANEDNTDEFWDSNRHGELDEGEQEVYQLIRDAKDLPRVKSYIEVIDLLVYGYKDLGKIEFGPLSYLYAFNNVEGSRFQLGFRTNNRLSKSWAFSGYGAYGTKDERFKGELMVRHILDRTPWTEVGASFKYDIERLGVYNDDLNLKRLFNAAVRFGNYRLPFESQVGKLWVQTDLFFGLTARATFRYNKFSPLYQFEYDLPQKDGSVVNQYSTTELITELSYAPGVRRVENRNNFRNIISWGTLPVLTFRHTYGFPGLFGSLFEYHKFDLSIKHRIRLGVLGRSKLDLSGGFVPSNVPNPLLAIHLGNQSGVVYNKASFNMMEFFEFASDKYASLRLYHSFDGMILNRVPLIKKLKWRLFITSNALIGDVSEQNMQSSRTYDENGNLILPYSSLGGKPYMEVGYGIENIFKFLRVDFVHRTTHLMPKSRKFAVMVSAQFRL